MLNILVYSKKKVIDTGYELLDILLSFSKIKRFAILTE